MPAFKRLSRVLASSEEIPFSNRSRIVLMSDCHRGDGSPSDDFAPNKRLFLHALRHYYARGYTYIEIGDGDELWENSRFGRILKAHEDVFLLLREFHVLRRLYMVWGNHDIAKRSKRYLRRNLYYRYDEHKKKRVPLLKDLDSCEGLILRHLNTGVRVFVVHGHQADFMNDRLWPISCVLARCVWRPLEILGVQDPISPAKNHKKRNRVEKVLVQWSRDNNQVMIAGHTHRPSFPEAGEAPYTNDGSCVHKDCITAMEISCGCIALVKWCQRQRHRGSSVITRQVLGGPLPLSLFLSRARLPVHRQSSVGAAEQAPSQNTGLAEAWVPAESGVMLQKGL